MPPLSTVATDPRNSSHKSDHNAMQSHLKFTTYNVAGGSGNNSCRHRHFSKTCPCQAVNVRHATVLAGITQINSPIPNESLTHFKTFNKRVWWPPVIAAPATHTRGISTYAEHCCMYLSVHRSCFKAITRRVRDNITPRTSDDMRLRANSLPWRNVSGERSPDRSAGRSNCPSP